jgi:hypothetical protein
MDNKTKAIASAQPLSEATTLIDDRPPMKTFHGFFLVGGVVRRVTLEANDLYEAQDIGRSWNASIEGEHIDLAPPLPLCVNLKEASRLLGGVSRVTLYRWMWAGELDRVPDTRRVLITRASLEKRMKGRN